jgi:hypothetical protein
MKLNSPFQPGPLIAAKTNAFARDTKPLLAVICGLFFAVAVATAVEPFDLGDRRELFVDRHMISSMSGSARLQLHEPRSAGIAFQFDAPWEGPASTFATVFRDGEKVRLYYRGYCSPPEDTDATTGFTQPTRKDGLQSTCYAESNDGGRTFTRPNLGLFEFKGSKENNVVWPNPSPNFAPFKDERPGVPDDERYKAVQQSHSAHIGGSGLAAFYSADGIHWRVAIKRPVLTGGGYDSHNVAFWDPNRQEYRAYCRLFSDKIREIGWARSDDFLTWTERELIDVGDAPHEHLYTNATQLYFRAPHYYFSFPMRLMQTRSGREGQRGVSDAVFMSSRDGVRFDRTFLEALIRPGRDPLNWGDRSTMPAWGLIQTGPDEMSLYTTQHYKFPSVHLQRNVWRLDGIASLHADGKPGELLTKPFRFTGGKLLLNYATSAAGSIRIEIQDADGKALPGYTLAEAPETFGDKIDAPFAWKRGSDVSALAGRPIRMRFVLKDADLYAWQFQTGS